jgi:predicted TIM-barrel fold metal-dependent hydrolase
MVKHGGGSVIFTSTFVGHTSSFPGVAAYAASKSGLIGLTQTLAAEPERVSATPSSCLSQDPNASAAEIRRVGKHSQVCAVAVPPIAMALGNRYWWPVYEAAQELDLPILLHVTGAEGIYAGAPMPAGGQPDTYIERYVTLSQAAEANLTSLIMNGIFERFPRLRVLFVEYGFVWPLPALFVHGLGR